MKCVIQNYREIKKYTGTNEKPNIAKAIIDGLKIEASNKYIELGCGMGGDANYILKQTGAYVLGVDRDPFVLSIANAIIDVVNIDLSTPPYPLNSGSFNGTYCVNTIHLIDNKLSFFKEIYRILKCSGDFFILITTKEQIEERYINLFFPSLKSIEMERHLFEKELTELLKLSGFQKVKTAKFYSDECIINRNYLGRLETGLFSSLSLLPNEERLNGLNKLRQEIEHCEISGNYHKYSRYRTAIIAKK